MLIPYPQTIPPAKKNLDVTLVCLEKGRPSFTPREGSLFNNRFRRGLKTQLTKLWGFLGFSSSIKECQEEKEYPLLSSMHTVLWAVAFMYTELVQWGESQEGYREANSRNMKSLSCCTELAKKFILVFHNILGKNLNVPLSQPNINKPWNHFL